MSRPAAAELEELVGYFSAQFDALPSLASCAPGRVNLIGDHTDYSEGFALPMAINRWAAVLARPADEDDASRFWFPNVEHDASADLTEPIEPTNDEVLNRMLGVAAAFQQRGHDIPNLDVMFASNIPIGAGLSSSAAMAVSFGLMLCDLLGITMDPLDLAWLCQDAEHAFSGTPCGIMDMYTLLFAEEESALLLDCRVPESNPLPLPDEERMVILVATTSVRHDLAETEYANRRAACEESARILGLRSLRDATLEQVGESMLTEEFQQYASHVITENTRTLLAAQAMFEGDLETVGDLMFASHASLADLYNVSCPELDTIVDTARSLRATGQLYGARMTGGGFGGSAVILVEPDSVGSVVEQIRLAYEIAHDDTLTLMDVQPAASATSLTDLLQELLSDEDSASD